MDWTQYFTKTKLVNSQSRGRISVHGNLLWTRTFASHSNRKNNRNRINHRDNFCLPAIIFSILALLPQPARANGDVGGVSATANPVATSSGSVTNQAIQVLQGPYINNSYGDGVSCQGPTLNITPYVTRALSYSLPYEDYYDSPVYSALDADDDGVVDEPGKILYNVPTRTGQKDSHSWSAGLSATVSFPLDGGLQRRCKEAADAQTNYKKQLLANKRLDFEVARLRHCGELKKAGIFFHPKSPYFSVCADVVVRTPPSGMPQHRHTVPTSEDSAAQPVSVQSKESLSSLESPQSSLQPSLLSALSVSTDSHQGALLGPPLSLPPRQ